MFINRKLSDRQVRAAGEVGRRVRGLDRQGFASTAWRLKRSRWWPVREMEPAFRLLPWKYAHEPVS